MILLLGGTSETSAIATALAQAGHRVLVSTATDEQLDIGSHPAIARRAGRLDESAMCELARSLGIRAIVDAAHPYAAAAHATAIAAARRVGIPCVAFVREGFFKDPHAQEVGNGFDRSAPQEVGKSLVQAGPDIHFAPGHEQAAKLAFSFGAAVLLTTGANNLAPYAAESRASGLPLVVRVLPRKESIDLCHQAGIDDSCIIAARGPFDLGHNLHTIREHRIGTLVTKDSGQAGGLAAKIEAARIEHCQIVVVSRPAIVGQCSHSTIAGLLESLGRQLA